MEKTYLEVYERELKKKMQEVEKAVKAAFQELYKNGKFKESDNPQGSPSKLPEQEAGSSKLSSSLSNSSDMTIQSVQLNSKVQFPSNKLLKNGSSVSVAE